MATLSPSFTCTSCTSAPWEATTRCHGCFQNAVHGDGVADGGAVCLSVFTTGTVMELVAREMRVKQSISASSHTMALTALDFTERRTSIVGW